MGKNKDVYKLFLNNNNILTGDDSRWTIIFPNWIPTNRECYVSLETCQIQTKVVGGINLTNDCIMLNSNLQTTRVYSQNYSAIGTQLCQINLPKYNNGATASEYVKLDNPTHPIYVSSLPNSLDFWVSGTDDNTELDITGATVNFILIIEFMD